MDQNTSGLMDQQTSALIRGFSSVTEDMPNTDKGGFITGLAIDNHDNILAVDNWAKIVKVFDQMGVYKYCFGQNILKSPWDVFVTSSGKIAVSDPGEADIKVFTKSGKYLIRSEKGHHLNYPHGIDYHPWSKETVIADRGFSCVYVHDPKGEVKDMITKQDDTYGLGSPNYACFDYAGNIYMTDIEDQSLIAYDTDRKHLFTYGHPSYSDGNEDNELNNPGSVIIDRFGNIILADTGNCRIHLIDRNGRLKDYLFTWEDGLGEPQAMTITEDGSLIVSEGNTGIVKIFCYSHLPIVNEIKLKEDPNGGDNFDVESIESGPSLQTDSEDEYDNIRTQRRHSSKIVKLIDDTKNAKLSYQDNKKTEKEKSAHDFRNNLECLSSNDAKDQRSNFSKSAGLLNKSGWPQESGGESGAQSSGMIKGILKKHRKPKFDFFTPKNDKDSNNWRDFAAESNPPQNDPNSAWIKEEFSKRQQQESEYSRKPSTLPESAGSYYTHGIEDRLTSSTPRPLAKTRTKEGNITKTAITEERVNSAGTAKSCDTYQSEKSDMPIVIIDKYPQSSAKTFPKLNLNIKSSGKQRKVKQSMSHSMTSKSSTRSHNNRTSNTSVISVSSRKSERAEIAIDNISEIPNDGVLEQQEEYMEDMMSDLTLEPFNDGRTSKESSRS